MDQTFRMVLSLICAFICYFIAVSLSLKELSHNSPCSINLCNLDTCNIDTWKLSLCFLENWHTENHLGHRIPALTACWLLIEMGISVAMRKDTMMFALFLSLSSSLLVGLPSLSAASSPNTPWKNTFLKK